MKEQEILYQIAKMIQLQPELMKNLFVELGYEKPISKEQMAEMVAKELHYNGDALFIEKVSKLIIKNEVFYNAIDPVTAIANAVGAVGNAVGRIVASKNAVIESSLQHAESVNETTQSLLIYMDNVENTKQQESSKDTTFLIGGISATVVLTVAILYFKNAN